MAIKGIKDGLAGAASAAAKGVKVVSEKAADAGGAIADVAAAAGEAVADKAKEGLQLAADAQQESRRRKFTPILREQYFADDFDLPQLVVIEDEDDMKGNEECVGAMGWLVALKGKPEVLHMYHGFVEESGLSFIPPAQIGLAYIVNPVEPGRFISDGSFFYEIQKEKAAEIQDVACCLGAKYCRVETVEAESATHKAARRGKVSASAKGLGSVSLGMESKEGAFRASRQSVVSEREYEGSDNPVPPKLRWFKASKEIGGLIDSRIGEKRTNRVGRSVFELDSSSSVSLEVKRAADIDAAFKGIKGRGSSSLETQSKKESQQKLVVTIEF